MSSDRRKIIDLPLLQQFADDGVGPLVTGLSSVTGRVTNLEAKFPSDTETETLLAEGWVDDAYSFETEYPLATYDLDIYLDELNATRAQRDAFVDCTPVPTDGENTITALDGAPAIDIPIIIKITASQGNGMTIHIPAGGSKNTGVPVMTGATASRGGHAGTVPAPSAGDQNKVLLGSGEFGAPVVSDLYNFCGEGVGAMVTVHTVINAIIEKLQARTVWKSFSETEGGEGGGGGTTPSGSTFIVDTYNLVGLGAGELVTVQQLMDAFINRVDSRTTWSSFPETPSEPEENGGEETPSEPDENDGEEENSVTPSEQTEPSDDPSETDPEETPDANDGEDLLSQIQSEDPGVDETENGTGE